MPATIDATPGGANANSYITEAGATAYFETRPNVADWTAATSDIRARALITATTLLDSHVAWDFSRIGWSRASTTQALRFPRSSTENLEGDAYFASDVIPGFLEKGTCETALGLIKADRLVDSDSRELSSLRVGPLSLAYNVDETGQFRPIPEAAFDLLAPWMSVPANASSRLLRTVTLVR